MPTAIAEQGVQNRPTRKQRRRTHRLFVDDLKVYQEIDRYLEMSIKLLYKQITMQQVVIVYGNVQRLYLKVKIFSGEKD